MNKEYDVIIVGAGPSGLALAQIASSTGKTVLILEKDNEIGGCHKVHRFKEPESEEMLFSEHGPRVYSSAFFNFKTLLNHMNINFTDLFTPYKFNFTTIGGISASKLKPMEIFYFAVEFLKLTLNSRHGLTSSVNSFARDKNFSEETIDYLDAVCRLTDGATAETYSLNQFLMLIDEQALYGLYQPVRPNDIGLFKVWKEYLEDNGVEFRLNTPVTTIEYDQSHIISVNSNLSAENYVFAIPPESLVKLPIGDMFGENEMLKTYSKSTEYINYISIIYHWNEPQEFPPIWGFPKNDWGIGFIILSDYMKFDESTSKTVISMVITKTKSISSLTGKTAEDSTDEEKALEVLRQCGLPISTSPTVSYVYPYKEEAYIRNINAIDNKIPFQSKNIINAFTLGTHNNMSQYHFTSMESAVSNSFVLGKLLYPESNFTFSSGTKITSIVRITYLISVILLIILLRRYNN